jgi:nitrate reductase delta subunit
MGSCKTWQVLGLALGYPSAEFQRAVPEMIHVLAREHLMSHETLELVASWLRAEAGRPLLDCEERYAGTFDGGRFLSLHLFEHVYGDGKERGRALAELSLRYAQLGVAVAARETPDYLPALCELASACGAEGVALLLETRPVLERLGQALVERRSPYAVLVSALVEALGARPADTHFDLSDAPSASLDLDALDRDWLEAPVEFGAGAAHEALVPLRRSKDGAAAVTSVS